MNYIKLIIGILMCASFAHGAIEDMTIELQTPIVSLQENNWLYINASCTDANLERFKFQIVKNSPNASTSYYQYEQVGLSGGTKILAGNLTDPNFLMPGPLNVTNLFFQKLTCRAGGIDYVLTAPCFNLERNVTVTANDTETGLLLQNYTITVNGTTLPTTTSEAVFWLSSGGNYQFDAPEFGYLLDGNDIRTFYLAEPVDKYVSPDTAELMLNVSARTTSVDLYLEDKLVIDSTASLSCYVNISLYNSTNTAVSYWWTNSTNQTFKTGSQTCESDNICTVDTLTSSHIALHDGFRCNINVSVDGYTVAFATEQKNKSVIGECSGASIYPIMNATYRDESTEAGINASNVRYSLKLYDGEGITHYSANYTNSAYDIICTDIDPTLTTLSLLMYGNISLSSGAHVTRIFNIPFSEGFTISNNPITQLNLYLLPTENITTVTYNWYTTSFVPINGIMLIYRCEPDGSKTLIDAPLITDGVATANIEAYYTAYSYAAVIDGTTYLDDSYTACHTESLTERTFYVDILESPILPLADLYGASCRLQKTGANQVKLTWSADESVEACIIAERQTVVGSAQIYEDCTTSQSGSMTRTIANNSNTYYVKGTISDGTYTAYCVDMVTVTVKTDAQSTFGIYGAFVTGLFILALALLFLPDLQLSIIGSIIALIGAFLLGFIAFGWGAVFMLIVFLIAVMWIGRYNRKQ